MNMKHLTDMNESLFVRGFEEKEKGKERKEVEFQFWLGTKKKKKKLKIPQIKEIKRNNLLDLLEHHHHP